MDVRPEPRWPASLALLVCVGLYIVRTLVGLLKGKVQVLDRPEGSGSLFEVDLPGRAIVNEALDSPTLEPTTASP